MKPSTCHIHQIYFSNAQLNKLEKKFIPFNNANGNALEREFYVFKKAYEEKMHLQADLTGFVSWKFRDKTNITGDTFLNFIKQNPGYDLYYINPFEHENEHESVWQQGARCHPEILPIAQFILNEVGLNIDLHTLKNYSATNAYCNFWVGSQTFWEEYMAFCMPIYEYIYSDKIPKDIQNKILFERADKTIEASYFPFIFERLFSTMLANKPQIKALRYHYSFDALMEKYDKKTAYLIIAAREYDNGNHRVAKNILSQLMQGW